MRSTCIHFSGFCALSNIDDALSGLPNFAEGLMTVTFSEVNAQLLMVFLCMHAVGCVHYPPGQPSAHTAGHQGVVLRSPMLALTILNSSGLVAERAGACVILMHTNALAALRPKGRLCGSVGISDVLHKQA